MIEILNNPMYLPIVLTVGIYAGHFKFKWVALQIQLIDFI